MKSRKFWAVGGRGAPPWIRHCNLCLVTVSFFQKIASCSLNSVVTIHKRSCGKVMFSQACVKNSVRRGRGGVHPPLGSLPKCMLGYTPPRNQRKTPPGADTPREHTHPTGADTPRRRHPLRSACWEIRATSGWYASYWNAFLFL